MSEQHRILLVPHGEGTYRATWLERGLHREGDDPKVIVAAMLAEGVLSDAPPATPTAEDVSTFGVASRIGIVIIVNERGQHVGFADVRLLCTCGMAQA